MVPSILNDSTAFWRDFEGPGLPENKKIEKKMLLDFCCFFSREKICPTPVFLDFGSHFGVSFGAPAHQKITKMFFLFGFFYGGGHSKFGFPCSLENRVFYEGVFQNLAFCSRVRPL